MTRLNALAASIVCVSSALAFGRCADRPRSTFAPTARAPDTDRVGIPSGERPDAAGVPIVIRCDLPSHTISPLIYGIGARPMHDAPHRWRLGATARRWGGNHTSRYNWELGNAWNTGKDWFFENVDYEGKSGPSYQRFIDDDVAHGLATALTVPTIGWVAKDTKSHGFPVSVFGPQRATAPENKDAGDGEDVNGHPVVPGSPDRTSVPMPPAGIGRWVRAVRERDAKRPSGGVAMYILDNEPTLWSSTHRDVHPEPVSYDELFENTVAYATEIRRVAPEAVIAGPALWGWSAMFFSGVDQAARPRQPDRDRHGGTPLLPWWLRNVAAREKQTGIRLVDLVDVHFYPQGKGMGVGTEGATDVETRARRIRSTRALWDPAYVDESWIADSVRLIPRLKQWIQSEHPGLGISIGEYNFGAEGDVSGGLAVAEALGRFGTEAITAAFYWDYPPDGSPAFWAFRTFRDFDGHGGRFLDRSVPAFSSDGRASVFASRDESGTHVVAVLLDLDPGAPIEVSVDASSCGRQLEARAFEYAGGAAGLVSSNIEARERSERLLTTLPPYSITVLDLHFDVPHAPSEQRIDEPHGK